MLGKLENIKSEIENELFNSVIPFWQNHSIDRENGGYYNCLDAKGNVFDTTKYMWLHGRQIWMFSKLYNTVSPEKEWLKIAAYGLSFMKKHAALENGRVYFSLNEKGEPVYLQRKIFTECFYAIALSEYGKAAQSEELITDSKQMFQKIWEFSMDPTLVGRPKFSGETPFQTLAVPMIMLNVMEEVYGKDFGEVSDKVDQCITKIKMHFINGVVYENVLRSGGLHNSTQGRLLNPGHAIEAGWFLLHWAKSLNDGALGELAASIIRKSFYLGWDNEFGGLYYFLDAEGKPPAQLEWNMKLWWPHCESLYAYLLLYSMTENLDDFNKFLQIKDYIFNNFSDKENGEWFGYLNRDGSISSSLKGGAYKGCFHVPRTLLFCLNILQTLYK